MNLTIQIIERNPVDQTVTARFLTDRLSATAMNPQMESGAPKLRADGLVARCDSDLCIRVGSPEPTGAALQSKLATHAPISILHAADPVDSTSLDSVTMLAEQAITLP